jgi:hypothetical protein
MKRSRSIEESFLPSAQQPQFPAACPGRRSHLLPRKPGLPFWFGEHGGQNHHRHGGRLRILRHQWLLDHGQCMADHHARYLWQRCLRIFPAFWCCLVVGIRICTAGLVPWQCWCGQPTGSLGYVFHSLWLWIDQPGNHEHPKRKLSIWRLEHIPLESVLRVPLL